ncbi:type I restriction-modification system specificity protein [Geobacillus kaustophilus HTA426]|uniref:Type I restriction-modification system specificity protein n=1 Tax=Geobacillus kaustophilus (strain HTA426) TaxID=235909 RepID=Q5L070_GEOKA|nr:restriction endonuclease subunit S [Geobacillus kaustophilus]BAD75666.1 type I restriction-modification system specificity protein [Geobacillus kaustophilus HTA426]
MSEWREVSLGEILEFKTGKLNSNQAVEGGKYPFFTCSPTTLRIDRYSFDTEAVLLAGNNANGIYAVKYYKGKFDAYQRTYVITPKDWETVDLRYMYYQIKLIGETLTQQSLGTATKFLTLSLLNSIKINLPPISIQRKIATILGSIDDKIELNLKMNQTLEEMAMTLYKHWFVDFGPFQDGEFVESELGMIPKGWSICELEEIVEKINERVKAGEHLFSLPYVPIDVLNQKSLMINGYKHGSEAKSSLVKFYKGDILFGAMRPYFHKVCIAPFDGITRTTCFVLRPKNNDYYAFVVATIFREETIDYANSHSKGSTIPYADWETLSKMKVILPPLQYLKEYNEKVVPLFKLMIQNFLNNEELVKTRDYLLPRLLSGEIDVSKAEKQVEEVL